MGDIWRSSSGIERGGRTTVQVEFPRGQCVTEFWMIQAGVARLQGER